METKDRNRSGKAAQSSRKRTVSQVDHARPAPRRKRRRMDADVVYTPAKAFDKYRFLLHLVTVVAVVLALTLGMSIFFKVENITVSGAEKYSPWDIREVSGIQDGENLLTLNKAMIGGKIITQLPYVEDVRIGIKLPDTVNIEITELDVVYAAQAADSSWWLMDANGLVLEQTTGIEAEAYTKILGVQLEAPAVGKQAVAAEAIPEETQEPTDTEEETAPEDETVADETLDLEAVLPETVPASQRLAMAITILQCLEENGIVGGVTSVDVTELYDLQLWYEDRYQVLLGDESQLTYKIGAMKNVIAQMTDYQKGELDVSFTTWPDKVGYTPFEE